ncbi:hypothetical protein [Chrysiogenes arsenatis]|uniref:hypothetical protein n=1 Tax=Chrysiogenes arsenatis TaxID=309797 RepID=UPI000487949B|nr:hypothetical protein [Chrysiogenes arsenatis]
MNQRQKAILTCALLLPTTAMASVLETFGTLLTTADERRALEHVQDALPVHIVPVAPTAVMPQITLHGFVLRQNSQGTVWYNRTSIMLRDTPTDGMIVAPAMCKTACIRIQTADGHVHTLRAGESTRKPIEPPYE